MAVRFTIETASKADAEVVAKELPAVVEAHSWRGLGVIRLKVKSRRETDELLDAVSRSSRKHGLQWARVRWEDEERVFRANGQRQS